MTDHELLAQFNATHDQDAFAELVRRHADLVYATAHRQVPHAAEDVLQAVFLILSRKSRQLTAHQNFAGWLYRVTQYCCRNVQRRDHARRHHEHEAGMQTLQPPITPSPSAPAELTALLDAALERLRSPERDALLLRFLQQKTSAETASLLGITEEAAKKRAQRGLGKLRAYFAARGFAVPTTTVAGALTVAALLKAPPSALAAAAATANAGSATVAALGIAKGAAVMMKFAMLKVAAMILIGVGIVACTGSLIAAHLAAPTVEPDHATSVPANPPALAEQPPATMTQPAAALRSGRALQQLYMDVFNHLEETRAGNRAAEALANSGATDNQRLADTKSRTAAIWAHLEAAAKEVAIKHGQDATIPDTIPTLPADLTGLTHIKLLQMINARMVIPLDEAMAQEITTALNVAYISKDPAPLVREVRAKEQWIETVASFHMKATSTWSNTPEAIAHHRAELKKDYLGQEPDEKRFPELLPTMTDTFELAFDRKRVFHHVDRPLQMEDVRIWDGARGMSYYRSVTSHDEQYGLFKDPKVMQYAMIEGAWPRADAHQMWWEKLANLPANNQEAIDPAGFAYLRMEAFHGISCYVLTRREPAATRWYVGAQDHLLHGLETGTLPGNPEYLRLISAEAAKAGLTIRNYAGAAAWLSKLPANDRTAIVALLQERATATDTPTTVHWMMDYVELKPGCWFPKTQGYLMYGYEGHRDDTADAGDYAHPWESIHREIQVTDIRLNEPLPNALFKMEFKEGVQVNDYEHEPPLVYPYKKDRPAEEFAKIVENAQRQAAKDNAWNKPLDESVGTPAPEFPETTWLNSKPLTWQNLGGKVVILDFFAEWCATCRNDFPQAAKIHQQRDRDGILIIGIHTPGSKQEDIASLLKEFKADYPICIDTPTETKNAWGYMFDHYHIDHIPYAVLIDQNGKIAAHGTFGQMVQKARKLTGDLP